MKLLGRLNPGKQWLEVLLALAVFAGLVRVMIHVWTMGYLPQPFFYEPYDVFMDWFNTADWARDRGVYDSWGSIYPPLSFVFLKLVGLPYCYLGGSGGGQTSYYARDCDWLGVTILHGFFILNIYLIARTYLKYDRRTALPRAFALSAGLPMLSALERGNLIIVTFTCLLIAFGPLVKSTRLRWLAAGLAVNFKLYLISTIFAQLVRRRWRWFEGALISVVLVYIVSYCIMGIGTPREIYENIVQFSEAQAQGPLDLWSSNTYAAFVSLLDNSEFPIRLYTDSNYIDFLKIAVPLITHIVQLTVLLAVAATWLRPEIIPAYRVTNLGLYLALITSEAGGHSQSLAILFVFMEKWKGFGAKWAIVCCYILCIPLDIPLAQAPPIVLPTYFNETTVMIIYYIMLGPFVRPGIILSIAFALSCVTIRAVWLDIKYQGWKERWRFRHDLPILLGPGKAKPPSIGNSETASQP